jgi:hypothetical protein
VTASELNQQRFNPSTTPGLFALHHRQQSRWQFGNQSMIENDESIASSSRFVTGKDGWDYAIDRI